MPYYLKSFWGSKSILASYCLALFCIKVSQGWAQNISINQIVAPQTQGNTVKYNKFSPSPQPILLSYNQNTVFIYFNASLPNTLFRYRLEGLLPYAITTQEHFAHFTNIPSGDYTFVLESTNHPELGKVTQPLTITPPLWARWWFVPLLFLYALLAISIFLYLLFNYRLRQKLKVQEIRDSIASDLHDDIGSVLTSIHSMGATALRRLRKHPDTDIKPILEMIIGYSKESTEAMRGIVMAINPQNDLAETFFDKIENYLSENLNTKEIRSIFEISDILLIQKFEIQERRNLFLIFKEITQNIIKHANAKTVYTKIEIQADFLIIRINDDGKGFDTEKTYFGNGLQNLKKRVDEMHGKLEILSQIDRGTDIIITLIHEQ